MLIFPTRASQMQVTPRRFLDIEAFLPVFDFVVDASINDLFQWPM